MNRTEKGREKGAIAMKINVVWVSIFSLFTISHNAFATGAYDACFQSGSTVAKLVADRKAKYALIMNDEYTAHADIELVGVSGPGSITTPAIKKKITFKSGCSINEPFSAVVAAVEADSATFKAIGESGHTNAISNANYYREVYHEQLATACAPLKACLRGATSECIKLNPDIRSAYNACVKKIDDEAKKVAQATPTPEPVAKNDPAETTETISTPVVAQAPATGGTEGSSGGSGTGNGGATESIFDAAAVAGAAPSTSGKKGLFKGKFFKKQEGIV